MSPDQAGLLTAIDGTRSAVVCRCAAGVVAIAMHAPGTEVAMRLPVAPGERFFGMGERFGPFALNGRVLDNRVADIAARPRATTSYSPTPFLLSSRGYALQLDTSARAVVDLRSPRAVTIRVAAGDVLLYVLTGPSPAVVLSRRAEFTGRAPVPPVWGLGVWKNLIGGSQRVRQDLDRMRAAGVPLDAVWIYDATDPVSGFGWPWPIYRPVPPGRYPNLPATITMLHRRGVAVLGYLSPFVVVGSPGYARAAAAGYLVRAPDGSVLTEPWMARDRRAYVDFTNPAASRWWQARVRYALGVVGFDGAMQDYGDTAPERGRYAGGVEGAAARDEYPVWYARAVREAAQSTKPDATVFFARSGYTGSQSFVTGRFTGDQTRDWSPDTGLPSALAGMLSGSISGWPYWGPDVGGFLDGAGAADRDLWNRWLQLGALSPVMRDMLGAQASPVNALTDGATLATFARYARLHRALEPYLHTLAVEAHRTGLPLMRPLWLTQPSDPTAWTSEDEYTLGTDLLVAPVLRPGMTARPVYLPAGRWCDYWSGGSVTGPVWIDAPALSDRIPLFVRAGSRVFSPAPTVP